MFLTDKDLKAMTGYEQPSAIKRWLDRNGYRYEVRRDGWPSVAEAQVLRRQGIRQASTQSPDFEAIR